MYYLSFDVANKSLAISLLEFNNNYKNDIKNIKSCLSNSLNHDKNNILSFKNNDLVTYLETIDNILSTVINYKYYAVEDLIPGKKLKDTDIFERTNSLKAKLYKIKELINTLDTKEVIVLIEYQMSSNYNANAIYNQIIYEFTNLNESKIQYKLHVMGPSYKNKIYFHKDLEHHNFIQKYSNNYTANKNHAKANFLYYLNTFNLNHILTNIKKKNIDDIADSFIQIFAYIKYCK
jgi:hypothetical protein